MATGTVIDPAQGGYCLRRVTHTVTDTLAEGDTEVRGRAAFMGDTYPEGASFSGTATTGQATVSRRTMVTAASALSQLSIRFGFHRRSQRFAPE
jgi:hypothetical protein